MDNNELLLIIFAFILGCMSKNMMKQMCDGRLVEGASQYSNKISCWWNSNNPELC